MDESLSCGGTPRSAAYRRPRSKLWKLNVEPGPCRVHLGDVTDVDALKELLRDEISGWPIGSGYYATAVGTDEAGEMADAIIKAMTEQGMLPGSGEKS